MSSHDDGPSYVEIVNGRATWTATGDPYRDFRSEMDTMVLNDLFKHVQLMQWSGELKPKWWKRPYLFVYSMLACFIYNHLNFKYKGAWFVTLKEGQRGGRWTGKTWHDFVVVRIREIAKYGGKEETKGEIVDVRTFEEDRRGLLEEVNKLKSLLDHPRPGMITRRILDFVGRKSRWPAFRL